MASITIKVKTLKEAAVELAVTGATTVGELKALIEQTSLKVPAAMQRLIYQGKVLKEEDKDIASFGVGEGSCLLLSDLSKVLGAATAASAGATPSAVPTAPAPGGATAPAPTPAATAAPGVPLPAHVVILRAAIQGVRSSNQPEVAATALRTLQTIIGNVVGNPHEAKYRQIKRSNATFDRKVGSVNGTGAILRAAGFAESPDAWELAASEQGWVVITSAKAELDAAVAALPPPATVAAPGAPPGGMGMGMGMGGGAPNPFGAAGMGMGGMPGMGGGGGGLGDMAAMMSMMQNNPAMRQQVLAQLRATRPEMAAQAEAMLANPGMLQGALQAMQQNPALMQQAMAMAGQQGGIGGMPPAMPGFGAAAPGAPPQPGQPGQQQQQQQQQQQGPAQQGANDAQMTEEEMIQEAINRSLQDM